MDIIDYIHTYDLQIGEREVICNVAKFDERIIIVNANQLLKECYFDSIRIYPHRRTMIATLTHNEYNIYNTKYIFEYGMRGTHMVLTRINTYIK